MQPPFEPRQGVPLAEKHLSTNQLYRGRGILMYCTGTVHTAGKRVTDHTGTGFSALTRVRTDIFCFLCLFNIFVLAVVVPEPTPHRDCGFKQP